MDLLSSDIVINIILPMLSKHAQVALQNASKRYYHLVLSCFPYQSRKHLDILGEVCDGGYANLLSWFLGRGKSDLRWSLLCGGAGELIIHGKLYLFLVMYFISFADLLLQPHLMAT